MAVSMTEVTHREQNYFSLLPSVHSKKKKRRRSCTQNECCFHPAAEAPSEAWLRAVLLNQESRAFCYAPAFCENEKAGSASDRNITSRCMGGLHNAKSTGTAQQTSAFTTDQVDSAKICAGPATFFSCFKGYR